MLSAVHTNVQQIFSFAVGMGLANNTAETREHRKLVVLIEFSCVTYKYRADTARIYLEYCTLGPLACSWALFR